MELQSPEIDPRSIRELGFRRIQSRLTFRKFMDNRIVDATVWFGFNELMTFQTKGVFRCKPNHSDGHQSPIRVEKDGDQPTNQVSAALWLDTIFQATGIRVFLSLRLLLESESLSLSLSKALLQCGHGSWPRELNLSLYLGPGALYH